MPFALNRALAHEPMYGDLRLASDVVYNGGAPLLSGLTARDTMEHGGDPRSVHVDQS